MKCLVLGGGGFLGSHLVDELLRLGFRVRIFEQDISTQYRLFSPNEKIEWFCGDFANREDVARAIDGCDIIYHLISTLLPKPSNEQPIIDVQSNVVSTLNLLELTRAAAVKKIIFISSGGTVYGIPQQIPIGEDHPTMPLCSYGITKLTIEKYLYLYRYLYGLDHCILRLANPFGERQRGTGGQGVVATILAKARSDEPVEIWGDGTVVRDYLYVKDAVAAMIRAIDYQGEDRIFNIGSGVGLSLNDVLTHIEDQLGGPVRRTYNVARALDVPVNVLSIERAGRLLHWAPKVGFEEGLARTWQWMSHESP